MISEVLKKNTTLTHLDVGCSYSMKAIRQTCLFFRGETGNSFGKEGVDSVSESLIFNTTLTFLEMAFNCDKGNEGNK